MDPKQDNFVPSSLISARAKRQVTLIMMVVIGLYLWSSIQTESFITDFFAGIPDMSRMVQDLFPPNLSFTSQVWPKLTETIHMAIIATTIAVILCIPMSLLAASNVNTNKISYQISRFFLNILRTIPDIILAVIFVGIFGIGVFPGILALIIFSLGILSKLISETIEAIDRHPMEAITASGGNKLQVIWYSVVPQVLPQFTSFGLYVFEINIRASVVLGLVGAGGVGQLLNQQINFFNYKNAMMLILIVFIIVIIIDYVSTKIREAIV
ncbi:phosphonate ABC transporter, permease protein PhnE [Bacillus lacus]|uniref:Phosphonate ABC transporter, permease protein PhnE n=1 Tax=Metabacillus lacus TaxID=1983721 RepID=A0A7X2J1Z9_9BACI|nr:phosphonate ABC transporter, permease protein PhnE [Metabacillus lacus]MRX73856.1 phosphonate ABC transporter, permease protein PhnE [Metabacillus lacus]